MNTKLFRKSPVKRHFMWIIILSLCFSTVVGCSSKPKEETEKNEPAVSPLITTTDTSNSSSTYAASPIVESYTRYLDAKTKAIELLNVNVTGENAIYLMQIAGIALMDVMVMHISVCGVGETDAMTALKFMGVVDAVYEYKQNDCRITYTDNNGEELSIHALHDPATDSMQFTVTSDGTTSLKYEYTKMKEGYATQYQSIDDNDESSVIMMNFTNDEIRLAIFDSNQFNSIYKKSNLSINDVPETGIFMHFANGEVTVSDNS